MTLAFLPKPAMSRSAWKSRIYLGAAAWVVCCAAAPAHAAQWGICDLQLHIERTQPSRAMLQAQVLSARGHGDAECPQRGAALAFRPATMDYQSELPRRQWPRPGQTVEVRYRYLDGMCKNRGACRIQHYSPVLR